MGSLGIVHIQTRTGVDPLGGRTCQTPEDWTASLGSHHSSTDVSLPGALHGFALVGHTER